MWCLINLHPRDPGGRENVYIRSDSAPSPSPRHHHRQRLEYPVDFALYSRSGIICILYIYIYKYTTFGCDVVRATTQCNVILIADYVYAGACAGEDIASAVTCCYYYIFLYSQA
jgi:hypothetical protein